MVHLLQEQVVVAVVVETLMNLVVQVDLAVVVPVEQLTVQDNNHLQTLQVDHLDQLIQVVAVVAVEQVMTEIVMEAVVQELL